MSWPGIPPIALSPSLESDELLESWVVRCAALNSLTSDAAVLESIYGLSGRLRPRARELGLNLGALCAHLGDWAPCACPEDTVRRATIYPYYRPFLTTIQDERARQTMVRGSGSGLKTLMGVVAQRFTANTTLRVCPQCADEDLQNIGAAYLRRFHQLVAVSRCAIHGSLLIPLKAPADRPRGITSACIGFRQLDALRGEADVSRGMDASAVAQRQTWFARVSAALLAADLAPLDPTARARAYGDAAKRLGHAVRNGRVDFAGLIRAVRAHYSDFSFLNCSERLLQPDGAPASWIRSLMARPSRSANPICHLLVIGYLFDGLADFVASVESHRNELHEDCACQRHRRTLAAATRSQPVALGPAREQALLWDASISCREAARRLDVSIDKVACVRQAAGIAVKRRPRSLTPKRKAHLLEDLRRGEAMAQIALRHKVSLSTLYRLLASDPDLGTARRLSALSEHGMRYRAAWLDAVRRSAGLGSKHGNIVDMRSATTPVFQPSARQILESGGWNAQARACECISAALTTTLAQDEVRGPWRPGRKSPGYASRFAARIAPRR